MRKNKAGEQHERGQRMESICKPDRYTVVVYAANIHDTKSDILAAKTAYERYPSIKKYCADAGYRGSCVLEIVDISEKIKPHQWEKLP